MNFMKKYSLVFTVIIGWIITIYSLYILQYNVYGNSIKTMWVYVLILVPYFGIAQLYPEDKKVKPKKRFSKILEIMSYVLTIVIIFLIIIIWPYEGRIWYGPLFYAFFKIISICKSFEKKVKNKNCVKERCLLVVLIYMLLIFEPIIFGTITGIHTINETQEFLKEQGYNEISYINHVSSNDYVYDLFEYNESPKNELPLGVYVFTNDDNESQTAIAVDVVSNKIIATIEVEENSRIDGFIFCSGTFGFNNY